jgi:hypothetical protein
MFLLLGVFAVSGNAAFASEELSIGAETVIVSIKEHAAGRNLIQLPSIEVSFSIATRCNGDLTPESLMLSVADTYKTLSAEQLAGDDSQQVVLGIPEKQIAPVAIGDFCIADESDSPGEDGANQLLIRDALSAQASLLCVNEAERKTVYASQPLDIQLNCERTIDESPDQMIGL